MALPIGFNNSYEYFSQVNEFLKENSWVYREANTEFVKAGILKQMPQEFQNYFINIETEELNNFPYIPEPLPNLNVNALKIFRNRLRKLIPTEAYNEPKAKEISIKLENCKKINVKKQHEIKRLAAVVDECLKINDEHVKDEQDEQQKQQNYMLIDFGSGLGYLSELLFKLNKNLLILGLEADTYRVEAAKKRVANYMPTATNSIQYRQQFINENSKDFIGKTVEEVLKLNYPQHALEKITTKMVIIGLHACADLTITCMKLFLQLPQVQQLIIMPCCYHKLQVFEDSGTATTATANLKFRNFPISESLKQVLLVYDESLTDNVNYVENNEAFTTYLNRPFLRLACQQTLKRWSKCSSLEHDIHGNEMFLRAVAESLKLEEEKMELVVVKRKEEKIELETLSIDQVQSFESFSRIYALKRKATNEIIEWSEQHRKNFEEITAEYPNGGKLAEGLTCLQTSMQKLCENIVLYDRLCYMEETAVKMNLKINVRYEKIMDEELSPRCYVLIAEKL